MSFYLKYRPQKVNDLDLTLVREFLERILASGKVTHAYLFTGPRGTGKTSAARILAKVVNCRPSRKASGRQAAKLKEPCNKCVECKSITDGSMVDLIEIDAASNRGIDDIRDLREKIRLAPVGANRKVYIIDEVHMLTIEAFNALLKTLEEPPEHALFVLATTEAHKVPETIASRCVRLSFPKANSKEVIRSLGKAVKGEKLSVSEGVLEEIAVSVDGSFREGMKILEQLSLEKGKITLEKAKKELGRLSDYSSDKFLTALVSERVVEAIKELDRLGKLGVRWDVFVGQCLETLRISLLRSLGVDKFASASLPKGMADLPQERIHRLIDLHIKASMEMKNLEVPQLALEILVAEWGTKETRNPTSPRLRGVGKEQGTRKREKQEVETRVQNVMTSDQTSETNEQKVIRKIQHEPAMRNKKSVPVAIRKAAVASVKSEVSEREMNDKWAEVLRRVRPHNHSIEGLLRSTSPKKVTTDKINIEVFYRFHLDQLRQEKFLALVEKEVADVFERSLKLEYYLGNRPETKIREVENIEGGVEDKDIIKVAEEVFGVE